MAGETPERIGGLLYDDFVMPRRESLGDLDQTLWEPGLDNLPADPWQHHMCLVLQRCATKEMFTFDTSSKTGRRAVGVLLKHYNRTLKSCPDDVPVVKLKTGGYRHTDDRVGWVNVPLFLVVGNGKKDGSAVPDTSLPGFLDDEIHL